MDKVLFVSTYGGFLTDFELDNMKIWKSLGVEVHCATDFSDPEHNMYTYKLDELGVIKHQVNFLRTPYSLKNIHAYNELVRIIKTEKISIIDTHNPVSSILSRLASYKCGINKVIYTVHGFFFYKGASLKKILVYKPIEYFMARITDYIIVINKEDYEAAKKMKVRKKAYYVPGVGVNVNDIISLSVEEEKKRKFFGIENNEVLLISVGENIKRKNHETALRAFAKIKELNARYMIVGTGQLHEYLKKLAIELEIENRVIFTGYRKDVNELLKMSDIYVFPSFQEGLSVALMQAMAAGLPVVASNIRGNVDCIDNEKGGITVEATDIDGMASAMRKLINNANLRRKYGEYNVVKVTDFSKEVVGKMYADIFKTVVD